MWDFHKTLQYPLNPPYSQTTKSYARRVGGYKPKKENETKKEKCSKVIWLQITATITSKKEYDLFNYIFFNKQIIFIL